MTLPVQNPVDDAELTRALADVMGHLKKRQYGEVLGHLGDALRGSGDAFIDTLARHLQYEEQVLFPALRNRDAQTASEVQSLLSEHAHLRKMATDLAYAIKAGEHPKAYEVAREFLADLYDHIGHEAKVTDREAGV